MSPTLSYIKNLLQITLAPRRGWEDLAKADQSPAQVLRHGFYPMLAVIAMSAVVHGFLDAHAFNLSERLAVALTQFLTLFASYFLARSAFEIVIPKISDNSSAAHAPSDIVCIYCLSILGVIQIISNLCPVQLTIMYLLPMYVAIISWQARFFLEINKYRLGQYILLSITTLLIIPITIGQLLQLLIV